MIEAQQMQKPMGQEQIQLLQESQPVFPGLDLCPLQADHQVTQTPMLQLTGTGQAIQHRQLSRLHGWKGEHVGGTIFSPPLPVQLADALIPREKNRKLSLF
jgi:hypothetical protein